MKTDCMGARTASWGQGGGKGRTERRSDSGYITDIVDRECERKNSTRMMAGHWPHPLKNGEDAERNSYVLLQPQAFPGKP